MTGTKKNAGRSKYVMLRALPPFALTEASGSPFQGSLPLSEMLLPRVRQVKIRNALFMQMKCIVYVKVILLSPPIGGGASLAQGDMSGF
jgi:hypothetical protein